MRVWAGDITIDGRVIFARDRWLAVWPRTPDCKRTAWWAVRYYRFLYVMLGRRKWIDTCSGKIEWLDTLSFKISW
jgi:hypothetical protein